MSQDEIKKSIVYVKDLVESGKAAEKIDELSDAGSRLLMIIDKIVNTSEKVSTWIPKEYSNDNNCILVTIFCILEHLPNVNQPFNNKIWLNRDSQINDTNDVKTKQDNKISFYELAISRSSSLICQLLGDRFSYIQKLLIKNLFGNSHVCSLFASDLYMFIFRIIHPHHKQGMCQIIMNLCRLAPPEAVIKGAALINRFKHPVVNFENPKYQYLLEL